MGQMRKDPGNLVSKGVTHMKRPESEIVGCNTEFGKLNPLGSSDVLNVPYQNKSNLDFFSRANIAIEKTNFSGILPEKGPYMAIVLKIESNIVDKQKSNESWVERAQDAGSTEIDPLYSIKARIPELHAHIPIPKKYETNQGSEGQNAYDQLGKSQIDTSSAMIIDMHPSFTCQPGVTPSPPQVGDIVWVDFNDKFRANGIYLGSLSSKTGPKTKRIYGNSSNPFDSGLKVDTQSLTVSKANGQTNSPEPNIDTQVAKAV